MRHLLCCFYAAVWFVAFLDKTRPVFANHIKKTIWLC